MNVLLIVTLPIEKKALINHILKEYDITEDHVSLLKKTNIYNKVLKEDIEVGILELEKIGNIEAAIKTFRALNHFKPNIVILTGICGGFKKVENLNLGDIVIPKKIIYYEFGKIKEDGIERRFSEIEIGKDLLESIKSFANNKHNVVFEYMLTGEKVIAQEKFYYDLSSYFSNIIAVEMESYGIHQAIEVSEVDSDFLVIKSIGDWADSTKSDKYHEIASNIVAEFVVKMLEELNNHLLK